MKTVTRSNPKSFYKFKHIHVKKFSELAIIQIKYVKLNLPTQISHKNQYGDAIMVASSFLPGAKYFRH